MRSSSYLRKWRSEAHVQSVPQEPRCMAGGLGKGFTPAHIHSQLGSYTNQIAPAAGRIGPRKGSGGWSFMTLAGWLRQTHIRHSYGRSCSATATSISCPGPLSCCIALGNEDRLRGSCTNTLRARTVCRNRPMLFCTESHHRDIRVSICSNEDWSKTWKLDHILPIFHLCA